MFYKTALATIEDDSPLAHYEPPLQKNNLTFGVEIEFALATAPASGIDPEPHLGGQILVCQTGRSSANSSVIR